MPSKTRSIQRRADGRKARHRANACSDPEGAEHQILIPSEFCALCFVTFGSHEKRVLEGDRLAHPRCVGRLRKRNAA